MMHKLICETLIVVWLLVASALFGAGMQKDFFTPSPSACHTYTEPGPEPEFLYREPEIWIPAPRLNLLDPFDAEVWDSGRYPRPS